MKKAGVPRSPMFPRGDSDEFRRLAAKSLPLQERLKQTFSEIATPEEEMINNQVEKAFDHLSLYIGEQALSDDIHNLLDAKYPYREEDYLFHYPEISGLFKNIILAFNLCLSAHFVLGGSDSAVPLRHIKEYLRFKVREVYMDALSLKFHEVSDEDARPALLCKFEKRRTSIKESRIISNSLVMELTSLETKIRAISEDPAFQARAKLESLYTKDLKYFNDYNPSALSNSARIIYDAPVSRPYSI